jgi:hypothetical protein
MLWLKRRGIDFSTTATIGRQGLHLTKDDLKENFAYFNERIDEISLDSMFSKPPVFAETFLNYLGAKSVHSFDFSPYEKATFVHDMNLPIPEQHKEKYSLVIDGGSLEHIFDFPTAMKNCMEMVKVGGHLVVLSPCNNYVGHGFYQFGPELLFRVFAPANGFKMEAALLMEERRNATWWSVRDPAEVGCRVTLVNHCHTNLFVLGRKVDTVMPFQCKPQQSDYVTCWTGHEIRPPTSTVQRAVQRLARMLLGAKRHRVRAMMPFDIQRLLTPRYDRRFFTPVDLRKTR